MPRHITGLLILVAVGLELACSGNEPSDVCASVTLTVSVEAPDPVFDWRSDCAAAMLEVTAADDADVLLWSFAAAPGTNPIRGPVTYGVDPEGAAIGTPAEPLISGQEYRVEIRRATDFLGLELMGTASFVLP